MENQNAVQNELNARGFYFESYGRGADNGAGCIIAFYKGNDARFAGQSLEWRRQPIVNDPFPSKAEAMAAALAAAPPS